MACMNKVGLGTVFSETKSVTFSRLHGILYVALLSNQQLPCGVGCVSHNFVNLFPKDSNRQRWRIQYK